MYNFKDFDAQFPDDAACLDFIFRARFSGHACECGKSNCFHRVKARRCYSCAFCGAQLHPTADTIFHKSETSLKSWFFAIFLTGRQQATIWSPSWNSGCLECGTRSRLGGDLSER